MFFFQHSGKIKYFSFTFEDKDSIPLFTFMKAWDTQNGLRTVFPEIPDGALNARVSHSFVSSFILIPHKKAVSFFDDLFGKLFITTLSQP